MMAFDLTMAPSLDYLRSVRPGASGAVGILLRSAAQQKIVAKSGNMLLINSSEIALFFGTIHRRAGCAQVLLFR